MCAASPASHPWAAASARSVRMQPDQAWQHMQLSGSLQIDTSLVAKKQHPNMTQNSDISWGSKQGTLCLECVLLWKPKCVCHATDIKVQPCSIPCSLPGQQGSDLGHRKAHPHRQPATG